MELRLAPRGMEVARRVLPEPRLSEALAGASLLTSEVVAIYRANDVLSLSEPLLEGVAA